MKQYDESLYSTGQNDECYTPIYGVLPIIKYLPKGKTIWCPEAEISKFIKLVQYKGVVECDNTVLRQFNISRLIIQGYSFPHTDCRNVQPYTLNCVAVEPSEAVELKIAEAEKVDEAIKHTNKWIKWVKYGAEVIDPTSLLKFAWL